MDIQINSALVDKFIEQANRNSQQEQDRLEQIGLDGINAFETNVQIWLGSLKDEIEDLEPAHWYIDNGMVIFYQDFKWNGCEGRINSSGWGKAWAVGRPYTVLKIHVPGSMNDPYPISLEADLYQVSGQMYMNYLEVAKPVNEHALAELLLDTIKIIDRVKADKKAREEKAREDTLKTAEAGYDQIEDLEAVRKYHAQICAQLPDNLDRWNAAMRRRELAITEAARKKQEQEEQLALEESEWQRLADEAAALFRPFTVYELKLAVKLPDDDKPRFTFIYATTAVPDESGWFTEVYRGQLRKRRPETLVDVGPFDIDSPDHPIAPLVCEHRELVSDRLPYITERALVTPAGLG